MGYTVANLGLPVSAGLATYFASFLRGTEG